MTPDGTSPQLAHPQSWDTSTWLAWELLQDEAAAVSDLREAVATCDRLRWRLPAVLHALDEVPHPGTAGRHRDRIWQDRPLLQQAAWMLAAHDLIRPDISSASQSGQPVIQGLPVHEHLWRHAVLAACLAAQLGTAFDQDSHQLFLGGLLHDLGHCLLPTWNSSANQVLHCQVESAQDSLTTPAPEHDHAARGAAWLADRAASLPLIQIVCHHHQPGLVEARWQLTGRLIRLADLTTQFIDCDTTRVTTRQLAQMEWAELEPQLKQPPAPQLDAVVGQLLPSALLRSHRLIDALAR